MILTVLRLGAVNVMETLWKGTWDFNSKSMHASSNKTTNTEQNKLQNYPVRKSYMLMEHSAHTIRNAHFAKNRQWEGDNKNLWYLRILNVWLKNNWISKTASHPFRNGPEFKCVTQHFSGQIMLQMFWKGFQFVHICMTISLKSTSLKTVLFSFWNALRGYRIQL